MGALRRLADGHTVPLSGRLIVGRAPTAGLRIDHPRVSGEHAALYWADGAWTVRDLGSRNGTWMDGRRLAAGETSVIPSGARIAFGASEQSYVLADASPPAALAWPDGGGPPISGSDGVLALPNDHDPVLVVTRDRAGRWIVENDAGGVLLVSSWLSVDGRKWRLELPEQVEATVDSTGGRYRLDDVALDLAVSRDEEFVRTRVMVAGQVHEVPFRAHHYLLATLARLWLDEQDVARGECGWVDAGVLCRMLAIDDGALNVQVHRARRELAALGVDGAVDLIERRPGRRLRIGLTQMNVSELDH